MMLVQVCDITALEEAGFSTTSQHPPVASQPRIDQQTLLDVASSLLSLLPPLEKQK
jgi:hypothetical protein